MQSKIHNHQSLALKQQSLVLCYTILSRNLNFKNHPQNQNIFTYISWQNMLSKIHKQCSVLGFKTAIAFTVLY